MEGAALKERASHVPTQNREQKTIPLIKDMIQMFQTFTNFSNIIPSKIEKDLFLFH